jgi:hypothetical protein
LPFWNRSLLSDIVMMLSFFSLPWRVDVSLLEIVDSGRRHSSSWFCCFFQNVLANSAPFPPRLSCARYFIRWLACPIHCFHATKHSQPISLLWLVILLLRCPHPMPNFSHHVCSVCPGSAANQNADRKELRTVQWTSLTLHTVLGEWRTCERTASWLQDGPFVMSAPIR